MPASPRFAARHFPTCRRSASQPSGFHPCRRRMPARCFSHHEASFDPPTEADDVHQTLCRAPRRLVATSTTATDVLQFSRGPGLFRNEWIFVWSGPRCVGFRSSGLLHFRGKRGIVAGKPSAGAFNRATVGFTGASALCKRAEHQCDKKRFHAGLSAQRSYEGLPAFFMLRTDRTRQTAEAGLVACISARRNSLRGMHPPPLSAGVLVPLSHRWKPWEGR